MPKATSKTKKSNIGYRNVIFYNDSVRAKWFLYGGVFVISLWVASL